MNVPREHRCRLLVDRAADGAWNMAVDELLAASVAEHAEEGCALRFYQWSRPTLSLGYFQSTPDEYRAQVERNEIDLVRRASGGGAILHDRELTYAFVVALDHPLAADAETLYRRFHAALVTVLARHQVDAELCNNRDLRSAADQPFLCFERRAGGDVVVGGAKIAGSAQRRQRQAILQHGSVLLATSPHAPHVPGLYEASLFRLTAEELALEWQRELAVLLRLRFVERGLSESELANAADLVRGKYGCAKWTLAR